jgi:hypothetical protein
MPPLKCSVRRRKRQLDGVYHLISEEHMPLYLVEFDFRYNARSGLGVNDAARTAKALKGVVGKRLTYRRPHKAQDSQGKGA